MKNLSPYLKFVPFILLAFFLLYFLTGTGEQKPKDSLETDGSNIAADEEQLPQRREKKELKFQAIPGFGNSSVMIIRLW